MPCLLHGLAAQSFTLAFTSTVWYNLPSHGFLGKNDFHCLADFSKFILVYYVLIVHQYMYICEISKVLVELVKQWPLFHFQDFFLIPTAWQQWLSPPLDNLSSTMLLFISITCQLQYKFKCWNVNRTIAWSYDFHHFASCLHRLPFSLHIYAKNVVKNSCMACYLH